jgi:hypothetical protein
LKPCQDDWHIDQQNSFGLRGDKLNRLIILVAGIEFFSVQDLDYVYP